jgi:hypothetical protein
VDIDNYRENCLALASKRRRLQVRLRGNFPKFLFSPIRKDSFIIGKKSNKLINLNDIISNANENSKDINIKKDEKVIKSTAGFLKPPMPLNGLTPPVPPLGSFLKPPAPLTGLKPPITGTGSNRVVQRRMSKGKSVDNLNSDQNGKGSDLNFETNFETNFEANFDINIPETITSKFSEFDSVPTDTLMNLDISSPKPVAPIHHPIPLATDSISTDNDNNDTPAGIIKSNNDNHDNTSKDENESSNHDTSIDKTSQDIDNGDNHKDISDKHKNLETPVIIAKNVDDVDNYDINSNESNKDTINDTDHLNDNDHENCDKENHDDKDNNDNDNDNTEVLNNKSNDDDSVPIDTLMNLDISSPKPVDPIHHPIPLATFYFNR